MKSKEAFVILAGVVAILLFSVWMFHFQKEMDKNKLIRQDIVNDSIIMVEQSKLAQQDSILKRKLKNHEYRIRKIETK